jgi:hypothetical protein
MFSKTCFLLALALLMASAASTADRPKKGINFFLAEEVFPHIAIGGVWSSEITFVNIDGGIAVFPLRFFKPDGTPWLVTIPGTGTFSEFQITVLPGRIFSFTLASPGPNVETGWALIDQPSGATVGGHVIFADRTPGRPLFEAVVPLSLYWENEFFIPFDNTGGNTTCMALANSSTFSDTSLFLEFFDQNGASIHLASRPLQLRRQQSFCLPGEYPLTAGKKGVAKVVGTASQLSALGFRFNPGGAFTTLFPMSR